MLAPLLAVSEYRYHFGSLKLGVYRTDTRAFRKARRPQLTVSSVPTFEYINGHIE